MRATESTEGVESSKRISPQIPHMSFTIDLLETFRILNNIKPVFKPDERTKMGQTLDCAVENEEINFAVEGK